MRWIAPKNKILRYKNELQPLKKITNETIVNHRMPDESE